jgi:pimeloyl-ACP methyl ester carboxylesterase
MRTFIICLALVAIFSFNGNANFKSIKVQVKGKGEPVLLLPGFTCPGEVWNETLEEIAAHKECHVVTYAGFGDVPAIDSLWLENIRKDLKEYIKQKEFKQLSIIGHSMGGTLALWLSSEGNNNISDILVVDALPCMGAVMMPNYSSENISYDNAYNRNLLSMSKEDFNGMAQNFAKFMCLTPAKQTQIVDWMNKADRKTYVYGYTDLLKLDLRKAVENINARVRILAAGYPGKAMVEQNYNKQYELLKNKEITFIENAAHFIMFDNFSSYIQNVKQFFSLPTHE